MDELISDTALLKLAIIVGFIGLAVLFIIMFYSDIPNININNINDTFVGSDVRVSGYVNSIAYAANKTTFINLSQECSILVIGFRKIQVDNGSYITVRGKVSEYNGQMEIIADTVQPG